MKDCIIVHYGEIALKGNNRPVFENRLVENIKLQLEKHCDRIERLDGRILIELKSTSENTASGGVARERLEKVFGIENFSFGRQCDSDMKSIRKVALDMMKGKKGSVKVDSRRAWKKFSLNSMEINQDIGALLKGRGFSIDLTSPKTTLFIEVLEDRALLYTEKITGPGGLPIGVSGKVVCLLSGGIDSPVAAWHMMKRGCEVVFCHFNNENLGNPKKVKELVRVLEGYQPDSRLYVIPFGDIQNKVIANIDPRYRMLIYRRTMTRIACGIAEREGAAALVTGESLGQVASQTIQNMASTEKASTLPVFRPLLGLDKKEIVKMAERIGTYQLSIRPYNDCCSYMIDKHPETKSKPEILEKMEKKISLKALMNKAIKEAAVC